MIRRILPHPLLSLTLFITWMALVGGFRLGSLAMAAILATALPWVTAPYWPDKPKISSFPALVLYTILVIWDIILANIAVAKIVLFMPPDQIKSAFITVPIDLKAPEAIAVLSATITLTPGTVTVDMSTCGRALLIHSLHAPDPDAIRNEIKTRYEARLQRIFG